MKIAIIGAGHLGAWLINNLKTKHAIGVFDTNKRLLDTIADVEIFSGYFELKNFRPELLINAVSIQNTVQAFEAAAPFLPPDCILSDVASVKSDIPEYYVSCGFRFASVHPMFGPTFANVERLADENVIIITESDPEGIRFFRSFFIEFGLKIYEYSFDQHDRMIAYSLTLPFASTLVFAACMNSSAVPGTTFKKHHEIAKGLLSEDDYLLGEILFNPDSLAQLEKVTHRLEFLKHVIKGRDMEEAKRFFQTLRSNIK